MQNQMMIRTKALASHHGRSALPLPSKRDPKIPTQKGKQIFSNNTIPTKNIQMTVIQSYRHYQTSLNIIKQVTTTLSLIKTAIQK